MSKTAHCTSPELELLYLGAPSGRGVQHADHCEACRRALSGLESERLALLRRHPPVSYVRALRAEAERAQRNERWQRLASSLAVAAVAAGLLLQWRDAPYAELRPTPSLRAEGRSEAREPVGLSSAGLGSAALGSEDEALLAKGQSTLSIIRKRRDDVSTLQGRVTVMPGDEVRVRFFLQARGAIVAGILTDAGEWMPWFDGEYSAGTHTPAATLRVTAAPGAGVVLLGAPDEVRAARAGQPANVRQAQLVWLSGPTPHAAGARETLGSPGPARDSARGNDPSRPEGHDDDARDR
jgi:hypothetical protein